MGTMEIISEIQKLPIRERLRIIEKTAKNIHLEEVGNKMHLAAEELYAEYKTDKELTAFTNLDLEDFYEAR